MLTLLNCSILDIEPGEELLTDYGEAFWWNYQLISKRQEYLSQLRAERDGNRGSDSTDQILAYKLKCEKMAKEIEELKKQLAEMHQTQGGNRRT